MKPHLVFASTCVVLSVAFSAQAQTSEDLDELLGQSIVSAPSKGTETDTTAPATSSVITSDELRLHGIRTLDEAINYLSLGMSTSSPSHVAEIGARGVLINGDYGNHVLLLLDGHVLNEPWNGTAYFDRGLGVPFEMIDHIEVILGPGSVLYGSQAMLGVINVVTKRAKDYRGARLVAEGGISLPPSKQGEPKAPSVVDSLGGGYRLGVGYGGEFRIGKSAYELTAGLEYYADHGPVWQLGPQPYGNDDVTGAPKNFGPGATPGLWGGLSRHADYVQAPASYLRLHTGDFQLALHASAFRRGTVFPVSLVSDGADFDDPYNHELDRFLNLDVSHHIAVSSRVELTLHGYGDLYDYEWHDRSSAADACPDGFSNGCNRFLNGTGRGLGGEAKAQIQWPVLRATTLLGVDARLRDVSHRMAIEDPLGIANALDPMVHRTDGLIAPYVAQSLSPTGWLDVNLGVRLDKDSRFGEKLSPRSALGFVPWRSGRIKFIYSEAFRGPSAYELTYRDPSSQTAALSLGPETVRSVEGSVEQRFGKHRLLYGVFHSWWNGLVSTVSLSTAEMEQAIAQGALSPGLESAYHYANIARVYNYGFNAAYDGAALGGRWRFGLNFTGTLTRIDFGDGSGAHIPSVAPQTFGNARTSYDLGAELPTLALAIRYAGRRLADRAYDGGFVPTPSAPPLLAMRATLSGALGGLPGIRYRVGGEYSFSTVEPYAIGATLYANPQVSQAELAPTRRAQAFVGLEYAFDAEALPGPTY